jgi:hypothetical protein
MGSRAGKPNKATATREKAHARAGLVPLMYMLEVLRDTDQPHDERMKAAIAAAPYVHPRLSTVQHQGDENKPVVLQVIERKIIKP